MLGALLLANCASAASTAKACEDKGFSCIAFWQREGEVAVISWVLVGVASCICSLSIFLLFLGEWSCVLFLRTDGVTCHKPHQSTWILRQQT